MVISRKRSESVVIPKFEIEITVVEIRGDKVKLGISAPTEIAVHRREVHEAIERAIERANRGEITP